MTRHALASLVACLALATCIANPRVGLDTDDDDAGEAAIPGPPRADAETPDPPASIFDPQATLSLARSEEVFAPGHPALEGSMANGDVDLGWAGDRWVLAWQHNGGAQWRVVAVEIRVGAPAGMPRVLDAGLDRVVTLAVDPGPPARVLWTTEGADLFAAPPAAGDAVRLAEGFAESVRAVPDLTPPRLLVWRDGEAALLDLSGLYVACPLGSARIGAVAAASDWRIVLARGERSVGDGSRVWIDERLDCVPAPERPLYVADSAWAVGLVPALDPRFGCVKDLDRDGLVLVDLAGADEPAALALPGGTNNLGFISVAPDRRRPGLLAIYGTGVYSAGNPLSTGVSVVAVDAAAQKVGASLPLPDLRVRGACVEGSAFATARFEGRERLGIAVATGCPERRLRFFEVVAER